MNAPHPVVVAGIGAWIRGTPDWPALRAILRGERGFVDDAPARPSADRLPGAERRRAPDSVRLAVDVATQACATARCDAATVPCVFASTWGDEAITDYVCATLARDPLELSPTKFHNSVLNAPAGYWTIATGCTAASSATTAHHYSFGAGLLEALALACAEDTPVLFASCDVASTGPLAEITRTTLPFGAALVLAPSPASGPRLDWSLRDGDAELRHVFAPPLRKVAGDNPTNAHALVLLSALAAGERARVTLPLSSGLSLALEITP